VIAPSGTDLAKPRTPTKAEPNGVGEDRAGRGHVVEQQRHAVETADGTLGRLGPAQLTPQAARRAPAQLPLVVQDTAETTLVRRVKSLRCLQEPVRRPVVRFTP
jgi:hypothetical protein